MAPRGPAPIDTPGHSLSWGAGCPACVAACPKTLAAKGNGFGALDPTAEETYATVEAVLSELGKLSKARVAKRGVRRGPHEARAVGHRGPPWSTV